MLKFETLQINLLCDENAGMLTLPKVALESLADEPVDGATYILGLQVSLQHGSTDYIHRMVACDLATNEWRFLPKTMPLSIAEIAMLRDARMAAMHDGRIIVCTYRNDMYPAGTIIFDPLSADSTTDAYEINSDPEQAAIACRNHSSLVTLHDGRILRVGGFVPRGGKPNTGIYDPATKKWAVVNKDQMTAQAFCVVLRDGRVLVTGGRTAKVFAYNGCVLYDVVKNVYTPTGSMKHSRTQHGGCLLQSGNVYICGGFTSWGSKIDESEEYDVATGRWMNNVKMDMTVTRDVHLTLSGDGRIIVNNSNHSRNGLLFNPLTNKVDATIDRSLIVDLDCLFVDVN